LIKSLKDLYHYGHETPHELVPGRVKLLVLDPQRESIASEGEESMRLAILGIAAATAFAGPAAAGEFQLGSADLTDGGQIAKTHVYRDCGGGNLSPALTWSGVPRGTQSLAVTIHDPDAPKAGGWWHWLVFDIPASTGGLTRGAASGGLPAGARQGRNDFGDNTYGGPCPPPGLPHHYVVTVWALDTDHLAKGIEAASPGGLAGQLQVHAVGTAKLVGLYGR
jgi:Raf kinase inhibitor-like YbhB/YbcL family protein